MRKSLRILLTLLVLAYPFLIFFTIDHLSLRYVGLSLACVFFLRFLLLKKTKTNRLHTVMLVASIAGFVITLAAALLNNQLMIQLYPVLVNLLFFSVFLYSRINPPTIIEKLARLTHKELSPGAIQYINNLTLAWCGFFLINAAVSLWITLFCSMQLWTLYNGLISYLLIGGFFAVEFLFRRVRQT